MIARLLLESLGQSMSSANKTKAPEDVWRELFPDIDDFNIGSIEKHFDSKWSKESGFAEKHSLRIALEVLSYNKKGEEVEALKDVSEIFEQWKYEFGVFPAKERESFFGSSSFLGKDADKEEFKQVSLSTYADHQFLISALSDGKREAVIPKAWKCCDYISTPIELFYKLIVDGYEPLTKYLERDFYYNYSNTLAWAIFLTLDKKESFTTSYVIEPSLKLATLRIDYLKNAVQLMNPLARKEYNRKLGEKIKRQERVAKKTEKIIIARESIISNKEATYLYNIKYEYEKIYKGEKVSETTILRRLKAAGI
jgi:hypothetical protein